MIQNLHEAIGEMLKIKESDLVDQAPAVVEKPAITPELIEELSNEVPELKDLDQDQLIKGMEAEADEHYDSVGGDMQIIAKITKDHLLEFPGQDYYSALQQLETGLKGTQDSNEPKTEETPADKTEEPTEDKPEDQSEQDVLKQQAKSDKESVQSKTDNAPLA